MTDIDLATIVARARDRCQYSSDPHDMDVLTICDAVERLRQLLTAMLEKCDVCMGSGLSIYATTIPCVKCGPIRAAAMEAK